MHKTSTVKIRNTPTIAGIIVVAMFIMLATSQVANAQESGPDPQAHQEHCPSCHVNIKNHSGPTLTGITINAALGATYTIDLGLSKEEIFDELKGMVKSKYKEDMDNLKHNIKESLAPDVTDAEDAEADAEAFAIVPPSYWIATVTLYKGVTVDVTEQFHYTITRYTYDKKDDNCIEHTSNEQIATEPGSGDGEMPNDEIFIGDTNFSAEVYTAVSTGISEASNNVQNKAESNIQC